MSNPADCVLVGRTHSQRREGNRIVEVHSADEWLVCVAQLDDVSRPGGDPGQCPLCKAWQVVGLVTC